MTGLKTIAATGAIVFAATAVAFGGVHMGQPSAGASATPTPSPKAVRATYTVRLTESDLEHLAKPLGGQKASVRHEANHHATARSVYRQVVAPITSATHHSETHHSTATRCRESGHSTCVRSGSHDGGCNDGGGCD